MVSWQPFSIVLYLLKPEDLNRLNYLKNGADTEFLNRNLSQIQW